MKKAKLSQAIDSRKAFKKGVDLSTREEKILQDITSQTDFVSQKVIWRSSYWGTGQIGAVHYRGTFRKKPAILKIQGAKTATNEALMIKQFKAQNKSKVIRPPKVYQTLAWDKKKRYEALIMEFIKGKKVLQSGRIQPRKNIRQFLDYYREYRKNCRPLKPWLPRPNKINWSQEIKNLFEVSQKAYPNHPFRQTKDKKMITKAGQLLTKIYEEVSLEFVHGHFSAEDLVSYDNQVILFSNLYWQWKYPFYDAVFAYHWFICSLEKKKSIKPDQVERQKKLWQNELFNLPQVKKSIHNQKLLKAALLERLTTALIIDYLLVDPQKPIAEYLLETTRRQIESLVEKLSS